MVSGEDDDTTDPADESTTSLKVVWHPPEKMGRPDSTSYAVEYKKSTDTGFFDSTTLPSGVTLNVTGLTATISGLEADTSYDVRVQATNSDGTGPGR